MLAAFILSDNLMESFSSFFQGLDLILGPVCDVCAFLDGSFQGADLHLSLCHEFAVPIV
jgi:hypothetical protein